jgi:hypothetical protein
LGKQKYSEGALIGKKFHGFESIQTNDVQSPISDGFHGTVLKELFNEVNQVTTLDQLLEKNYPNIKKQNAFVKGVAQEYFTAKAKEVPVEFEEKNLDRKTQLYSKRDVPGATSNHERFGNRGFR